MAALTIGHLFVAYSLHAAREQAIACGKNDRAV
jgi:hypothetical protein